MRDNTWIKFEIPLPWSARPVVIKANGFQAVIVAGLIAALLMVLVVAQR